MDVQGPEPAKFSSEKEGQAQAGGQFGREENLTELEPLVDKLCRILKEMADVHEKALKLAEEKKERLIENDIEGLSEVVEREEKVLQEIETLEKERGRLADKLAGLTGEDELNISALKEQVSGERRRRLKKLQNKLNPLLEELDRVNEQNRQLLLQAMKFNEVTFKLFLQGADEQGVYKKPEQEGSAGDDGVDKEQVRNIIDRRA
ncbi:flagellar protein FlgN [Halarsenatibacter silvermanii]|uniref:FlgN protein n=1 Tax=Halarsenatibacter silvermanii TaxID=321763 RepID=A0A1G9M003_9FIRM|nr:flagellar protein FlgN [Halarsenatibacter silvermanii]SDL67579.1 FlgN protein [Halarsenatibacter silvermanii]